jgi:hypothetical protein
MKSLVSEGPLALEPSLVIHNPVICAHRQPAASERAAKLSANEQLRTKA